MFQTLKRTIEKTSYRTLLLLVLYFSVLFRLILIPNPGFEADVAFWKSWGLAQRDGGIVWAVQNTNNNYPTPFTYTLGNMVRVYSLFKDPHNWLEFWDRTNTTFLTVSKMLPIMADYGIFLLFLLIGTYAKKLGFPKRSKKFWLLLGSIYLLNPVTLIDGAWWGQVDSVGVFIFLLAILISLLKLPFLACLIYMFGMMTKLQNMIYGPMFFLFIWYTMGKTGLMRAIAGSALSFFLLNIEFILAREMKWVINSLTINYDYFPWMSLNAYNLWWIVSGAKGMEMSDKVLALGIINAKTMGLFIFSSFYLMAVIGLLYPIFEGLRKFQLMKKKVARAKYAVTDTLSKYSNGLHLFLIGITIVANAFFLFQTESHDRYAFPLTVFVLLVIPFVPKKQQKYWLVAYSVWSIFFFYNLHNALVVNYPHNGMVVLKDMGWPWLTISTSGILIFLFFLFLFAVRKRITPLAYFIPLLFLASVTTLKNAPILLQRPISLTKFTPIVSEQNYGTRATNMPTNTNLDPNDWDRLSVQYSFYKHGIGIHANSVMNYEINGLFKRFTTDMGIDTRAGDKGSAIFQIYGDGELLFESDVIRRFDDPIHTEVNIEGVQILGLVTTDAGDGITDDHTDWLNPILWPF